MAKNNNKKILILGAGMAGLGASVTLKKAGYESTLLDMGSRPGGLFSNLTVDGCDFDYGPKILLLDESENSKEILSYLGDNYEKYPVRENVYHSKYGLMNFPLQRNLIDLPVSERKRILKDLEYAINNPMEVTNFKDWLISKYGRYFAEMILIPYEQKKWQLNLEDMDYRWALKRPVKVDLEEVVEGSKRNLPPNKNYYYPKKGNISVLSEAISKKAGTIIYNQKITKIDLEKKLVYTDKDQYSYDVLISSIPLDEVINATNPIPEKLRMNASSKLKRLSVYVFNLVYSGDYELDGTAIYYPEDEFIFRRVSVLQNLCPALKVKGKTSISVEVSVKPNDKAADIYERVLNDLNKIEQFAKMGTPKAMKMIEVDFAYPHQLRGLSNYVADLHRYFRLFDFYHCGRGGNYDYCNGDQAYKQGAEIAKKLVRKLNQEITGEKKDLSLTVGIPSYKSDTSIVRTVESLLASEGVGKFKVLISADGEMDKDIRAQLLNLGAEIIDHKIRQGQTAMNKKLAMSAKTDLLVLTQDDVVFKPDALRKIVDGFKNDLDLTMIAPRIEPLKPNNYFEEILHSGVRIARDISKKWKGGDNYLSSIGRCLAYQIDMIQKFEIDDAIINCDAYYYFENRRLGGKFAYADDAVVYYRSPQNMDEHLKQVRKFVVSEKELSSYLKMDLNDDYSIPGKYFIPALLKEFVKHPVLTSLYLAVSIYSRTRPKSFYQKVTNKWEVDQSTKNLT